MRMIRVRRDGFVCGLEPLCIATRGVIRTLEAAGLVETHWIKRHDCERLQFASTASYRHNQ
jgi:hypothetical protein